MKKIAVFFMFVFTGVSFGGYEEAFKAVPAAAPGEGKELIALLALPGAALAGNDAARRLLTENAKALNLFREAASQPNDGYLFAPKVDKPSAKTPAPSFAPHLRLFRLALIDAKISAAQERPGDAEKDLLAAAGFIYQSAAQKSAPILSGLVTQLCLGYAFAQFSESLRGGGASPAYMAELARRLDAAAAAEDMLRLAMLDQAESVKNTFFETLSPENMKKEISKLPFMQRLLMKRYIDSEFVSMTGRLVSAMADARAQAYVEAFAANDPALAASKLEKLDQERLAQRASHP